MPTRIVAGAGALTTIGNLARELKMSRILVVSDPIISQQPFHAAALDSLKAAGLSIGRVDECGICARCSHIDAQGERARRDGIDGIVCIGGGSVMCTGKGIAIVATNPKPMRECTGVGSFDKKALPMIMVPTTAGSGSEVSQWTIVKDEERHLKLLGGGPLSFPDAAILDPVTLRSLPMRVAALPAIDALLGLEAIVPWYDRIAGLGHGKPTEATAEAALAAARAAQPASVAHIKAESGGPRIGSQVLVTPDDNAKVPVAGKLVAADATEIVIHRTTPEANDIHVHFPRAGFEIKAA